MSARSGKGSGIPCARQYSLALSCHAITPQFVRFKHDDVLTLLLDKAVVLKAIRRVRLATGHAVLLRTVEVLPDLKYVSSRAHSDLRRTRPG
jgi:hypothetical protein